MQDTIEDISYQIFTDISETDPVNTVLFTKEKNFPSIEYSLPTTYWMPLPREVNGMWVFEGNVYNDYTKFYSSIWNLYLVSLYHIAGHASITNFDIYREWIKNKTPEHAFAVIEHIEDIRVEEFFRTRFPEYLEPTLQVKKFYDQYFEAKSQKSTHDSLRHRFANLFDKDGVVKSRELELEIRSVTETNSKNLLKMADFLYANLKLVETKPYPFIDRHNRPEKIQQYLKNPVLKPLGIASSSVNFMNELWEQETRRTHKMQKKFSKLSSDLHFDKVDYIDESIGDYLKLRNDMNLFLRKLVSQIKMMPNVMDNAMPEDMGVLEMQRAIQAIAAQNDSIQIFEQDDQRRMEEEWAIVLDTSSSMKFRFEEVKSLALCIAEASNELNSKTGKWGMYCVNNNFNVIKDNDESYSQKAKSRVGGIEVGGLSFLPDGITLVGRILLDSEIEKKVMFVITDGQSMGYEGAEKRLEEVVIDVRKKGIKVIGIGVPKSMSKTFTMIVPLEDMRKTMAKFIRAYRIISEEDL